MMELVWGKEKEKEREGKVGDGELKERSGSLGGGEVTMVGFVIGLIEDEERKIRRWRHREVDGVPPWPSRRREDDRLESSK